MTCGQPYAAGRGALPVRLHQDGVWLGRVVDRHWTRPAGIPLSHVRSGPTIGVLTRQEGWGDGEGQRSVGEQPVGTRPHAAALRACRRRDARRRRDRRGPGLGPRCRPRAIARHQRHLHRRVVPRVGPAVPAGHDPRRPHRRVGRAQRRRPRHLHQRAGCRLLAGRRGQRILPDHRGAHAVLADLRGHDRVRPAGDGLGRRHGAGARARRDRDPLRRLRVLQVRHLDHDALRSRRGPLPRHDGVQGVRHHAAAHAALADHVADPGLWPRRGRYGVGAQDRHDHQHRDGADRRRRHASPSTAAPASPRPSRPGHRAS